MTAQLPIDIYGRRSRDPKLDGVNVADQLRIGEEQIRALGLPIGLMMSDNSKSAYDTATHRRAFELLMQRMRTGISGGIWVLRYDRFDRQASKSIAEEVLRLAKERGIRFFTEAGETDLKTPDGRRAFRDSSTAATHFSELGRVRVLAGKHLLAKEKGKNTMGGPAGFAMPGIVPMDELTPEQLEGIREYDEPRPRKPREQVAAERRILSEIADRFLARERMSDIAADLNARGIRKGGRGPWTVEYLNGLLQRPQLVGEITFDGNGTFGRSTYTVKGTPALDRERFDQIQAVFGSRRRGETIGRALLSGLGAAWCGKCGRQGGIRSLPVYNSGRGRVTHYPDGERKRDYYCGWCAGLKVNMRAVDYAVREMVIATLSHPEHARQLAARAVQLLDAKATVRGEIAELERLLKDLAHATSMKLANAAVARLAAVQAEHDRLAAPLEGRLNGLYGQLTELSGDAPPMPAEDVRGAWEAAQEAGNTEFLRRMVMDTFPNLTLLPTSMVCIPAGRKWDVLDRIDWTGEVLAASAPKADAR